MKIHKGMCISIEYISNWSYKKRTTGFFLNRDTTYNFNSSNKDVIDLFHKHKQYKYDNIITL